MAEYRLGLALSGGSVKGFAHIGVLKYMEEIGLKPDIISGTSAGSMVGALYADGYTPDDMYNLLQAVSLFSMTSIRPIGMGGMLDTTPLLNFVDEHLSRRRLENLPIPLRIVATDLDKGEQHVFTEGDLPQIVMASCSIPVLFHPIEIDGTTYVDGGLFRNFPVTTIREDCDILIGMNLGPWEGTEYKKTIISVAERSLSFIFRQNTLQDKEVCDILIEPKSIVEYGLFDTDSTGELFELGYEAAKKELTPKRLKAVGL